MQLWLSPENLMTLVWENGLDLAEIVRCQFGKRYDGSEARNTGGEDGSAGDVA